MDATEQRRPGERIFGLLLVLISGFILSEAYAISGFKGMTTGGVMPMLASGIMLISSVCIVIGTWQRPPPDDPGFIAFVRYLLPLRVVFFANLVAIYAVLIPSLGFLAATGGFLFISIWLLWRRGPVWSLAIAAFSTAVIHILFRMVFQVVLPSGMF